MYAKEKDCANAAACKLEPAVGGRRRLIGAASHCVGVRSRTGRLETG